MDLKELIYFNKKKIYLTLLVIFCIVIGLIYYYCFYLKSNDEDNHSNEIILDLEKDLEVEDVKVEECFFDIKGEVKKPGVYSIECDKRVIDAIDKGGGLTKNSDTSVLNLSKRLEDGMVIIVYSKNEVKKYLETLAETEKKQTICDASNIKNDACNETVNSNSNLININTASLSELMTLTGIGESKAKNIISYREKTPFKKIEDILNVEGIGESIYVSIKENITV